MSDGYLSKLISEFGALKERITELEKNCEVSFAKVEDHIERILKVIDVQAQSIEMLTDQIAELKELVDFLMDSEKQAKETDYNIKEVLQKVIKAMAGCYVISNEWRDKLLEKLK